MELLNKIISEKDTTCNECSKVIPANSILFTSGEYAICDACDSSNEVPVKEQLKENERKELEDFIKTKFIFSRRPDVFLTTKQVRDIMQVTNISAMKYLPILKSFGVNVTLKSFSGLRKQIYTGIQLKQLEEMPLQEVNLIKVPEVPEVKEVKEVNFNQPSALLEEEKKQRQYLRRVHEAKRQKVTDLNNDTEECVTGLSACISGNKSFEEYLRKEKFTFQFFNTLVKTQNYTLHELVKELAMIFQGGCDLKTGELYAIALFLKQ